MKRTILLYTLFLALMQGTVWSQIPKTMSYQGVLKDATGALVADGNYSITFNLYDVATGGTALWTETQSSVSVASGVFSVILGSATTLDLTFDKQYWLGVTVGTDTELSPRIKLTASPYSLNALSVAGSSNAFPSSGNVGIGTTSPSYKLDVAGNIGISSNSGSLRLPSNQGSGSSTLFNYSDGKNYIRGETKFDSGELVYVAGNVGIGTTSPAQKLEVAGNVQIGDTPIAVTTAAIQVNGDIHLGGANREILNAGNNSLAFGVNNTVKMTIASTGNVGIGTADPDYLFHVMGGNKFIAATTTDFVVASAGSFIGMRPGANTGDTYSEIRALTGGAGTWGDLVLQSGGGKVGIGTTSPNTQLELYKSVSAGVGSAIRLTNPNTDDGTAGELEFYTDQSTGKISFIRTGVSGAPADISFSTHKSDAAGVVEHMRIKNTGNVGIGTTSPRSGSGTILDVNGSLYLGNTDITDGFVNGDNAVIINIDADNDGTTNYFSVAKDATTGGTELFRVQENGNVGIGTTSPSDKLHVYNNTATVAGMTIENVGVGNSVLTVKSSATTIYPAIRLMHGSSSYWDFGSDAANSQNFYLFSYQKSGGAGRVFSITKDGNIGIGTTAPGYPLHVKGSSGTISAIEGTVGTNRLIGTSAIWDVKSNGSFSDDFVVRDVNAGKDRLNLKSNGDVLMAWESGGGNVGIGTTNPGQKLSVAGTVESTSGGFKFPDGSTQTSAVSKYDSGWFPVTQNNGGYTKAHGLGTIPDIVQVWFSDTADGSGDVVLAGASNYGAYSTTINEVDLTNIKIYMGQTYVVYYVDANGVYRYPTSGYMKIVAVAF